VALDVSTPSLDALRALRLPNVEAVEALVERYEPAARFDWIVMSEVIEHMRDPAAIVRRCVGWLAPAGSLLVTTPHGHWESNEHLQEFSLASFADALCRSGAEGVTVEYLRDREERRRWLVGQATAAARPPAADDFSDTQAVAKGRKGQGSRT
jgi:2-polyprenyl-3-methyl-5-hydroxy-6-metoxy-1,4-benzoquinol methylase